MKILSHWLRTFVPNIPVDDQQLAEDLTLRGIAVEGIHDLGAGDGRLFEMDITTNRVDAMNHYGIAREAATIYNLPLLPLAAGFGESAGGGRGNEVPVRIAPEAAALCGRFTARVVRGITVGPARGAIAHAFSLLGQKQISAPVDASNYTLLGMGHPTHAFDLDRIAGGIVVRLALPGETLTLLDGTTRTLHPEDLVIADEVRALSLAGVMGGLDSSITPATRNVLIESAWFDPATIRASSRRHLIHTDASHRFERGADFAAAPVANRLVTNLILEQCGGEAEGDLIDIVQPAAAALTTERVPILLSVREVQRQLGATIDPAGITGALVEQYLAGLGCTLAAGEGERGEGERGEGDCLRVQLPSWRLDLSRGIDLIEEVARVYGYNRFANTLPTFAGSVQAQPSDGAERAVRGRLLALGYSEAISSSFASAAEASLFAASTRGAIPLENPLSDEAGLLRPTLVPGMLTMVAHNLNRDVAAARLFEAGHIFGGGPVEVKETLSLCLGLTGAVAATPLYSAADAPFYHLKASLESLLSLFEGSALTFSTERLPAWLEPTRAATASLGGEAIAHFGQLSSVETQRRKLRQAVYLAEIDLAALLRLPLRQPIARELSRFQAVERDFSFTLPDSVRWGQIAAAIEGLNLPELEQFRPVEIFRDAGSANKPKAIPAGHASLLLRTVFQSLDRTLRDEELATWSSAVVGAVERLGGVLRG